jgi:hypothetical protein
MKAFTVLQAPLFAVVHCITIAEQAVVPPGLPRPNSTVSYWQDPPASIAAARTTSDLPKSADYVIVGSGISGAMIAYNILAREPNASVVILEARGATSGATGRNGRFPLS